MTGFLSWLVVSSRRHYGPVSALALLVTLLLGYYAAVTLDVNTDTSQLIEADSNWAKQSHAFNRAFPQTQNATDIVIDGRSADAVADGAKALAAALATHPDLFHDVRQPDGGPFFDTYGLMFLDTGELARLSDQLARAQPLLGPLAADPSLRGLFGVLGQALGGFDQGADGGDQLRGPLGNFAAAARSVAAGHPAAVDWGTLMTGRQPRPEELRHFIELQPTLDFDALEPGARADGEIRRIVGELKLAERGVRVRLTGDVPIEDDEFASVTEGAGTATALTAVAVLIILLVGLRAPRVIAAIMLTLVVGLIVSAALATVLVGKLNMISIAFAVLFIGIGVDFGIQFSMRYRAELFAATMPGTVPDRTTNGLALDRTGRIIAGPLAVAALATAVGFFSFVPTRYRGVSELGLIAGSSMVVALAVSLTVLPALLALFQGRGQPEEAGFAWLRPVDRWIDRRARLIAMLALVIGVGSAALIPSVRFDGDPLHLKDPRKESLQTALDLAADASSSPYTIDVLAPSVAEAGPLADRLATLSEVKQVVWLASFVPADQAAKLEILDQIKVFLGPVFDFMVPKKPPSDAEERAATTDFLTRLVAFNAGPHAAVLAPKGKELAAALSAVTSAPNWDPAVLRAALLQGLPGRLASLRSALGAGKLSIETIPASFRRDWVSADGQARIKLFPSGNMAEPAEMARFVAAVRAAAPNASGPPVAIFEAGRTVGEAFRSASLTALVTITLTLAIVLRRLRDVALVVGPLVLAALYALATCALLGLEFNYANVVAVPLLMGIGVAFDIYFVMAWRRGSGPVDLLQTATTRAVVFSACTTATAFGSLALSHHAGTASMGLLLLISLFWVVLSTLFIQPALMSLVGRHRDGQFFA